MESHKQLNNRVFYRLGLFRVPRDASFFSNFFRYPIVVSFTFLQLAWCVCLLACCCCGVVFGRWFPFCSGNEKNLSFLEFSYHCSSESPLGSSNFLLSSAKSFLPFFYPWWFRISVSHVYSLTLESPVRWTLPLPFKPSPPPFCLLYLPLIWLPIPQVLTFTRWRRTVVREVSKEMKLLA